MNIDDIYSIEIIKSPFKKGYASVRISVGGHMFFDSPIMTRKMAQNTFDNLDERLK